MSGTTLTTDVEFFENKKYKHIYFVMGYNWFLICLLMKWPVPKYNEIIWSKVKGEWTRREGVTWERTYEYFIGSKLLSDLKQEMGPIQWESHSLHIIRNRPILYLPLGMRKCSHYSIFSSTFICSMIYVLASRLNVKIRKLVLSITRSVSTRNVI
jgi:hypothetical protein